MRINTPTPLPPPTSLPNSFEIPSPTINEPTIGPLEWEPIVIYPEDVIPAEPRPTAEEKAEEEDEQDERDAEDAEMQQGEAAIPEALVPEIAEIQTIQIPIIDVEVPVPRAEILATAATTAGISSFVAVGGTLFATTLFRQLQPILKPIFKKIFKKLAQVQKKPPPLSWSRERLLERRKQSVLHQSTAGKKVNQGR